ncbi:hypothetical protein [Chlamydia gallinacea]|uniref:hypothetical protein n=1 Tax=Chlamydia gallinacea TaxID=1457153 RepID=UPI0023F3A7C6|nr:hypothetical protein [Chlamydia gallinacea]
MVKGFFIYNLICILSLCSPIFTEDAAQTKEEEMHISVREGVQGDITTRLDELFEVFLERGQELYRDFLEAGQNVNFANSLEIVEFIKSSNSGRELLQTCDEILACLQVSSDELIDSEISYDALLQKLEGIVRLWQEHNQAKGREYAYRELELREKELEFKKDLLAWQKEKMAKEIAQKREKYTQDMILRRFS